MLQGRLWERDTVEGGRLSWLEKKRKEVENEENEMALRSRDLAGQSNFPRRISCLSRALVGALSPLATQLAVASQARPPRKCRTSLRPQLSETDDRARLTIPHRHRPQTSLSRERVHTWASLGTVTRYSGLHSKPTGDIPRTIYYRKFLLRTVAQNLAPGSTPLEGTVDKVTFSYRRSSGAVWMTDADVLEDTPCGV